MNAIPHQNVNNFKYIYRVYNWYMLSDVYGDPRGSSYNSLVVLILIRSEESRVNSGVMISHQLLRNPQISTKVLSVGHRDKLFLLKVMKID
jgi:hypothetical protein